MAFSTYCSLVWATVKSWDQSNSKLFKSSCSTVVQFIDKVAKKWTRNFWFYKCIQMQAPVLSVTLHYPSGLAIHQTAVTNKARVNDTFVTGIPPSLTAGTVQQTLH